MIDLPGEEILRLSYLFTRALCRRYSVRWEDEYVSICNVAIVESLPKLRQVSRAKPYIYLICKSRMLDLWKRKKLALQTANGEAPDIKTVSDMLPGIMGEIDEMDRKNVEIILSVGSRNMKDRKYRAQLIEQLKLKYHGVL